MDAAGALSSLHNSYRNVSSRQYQCAMLSAIALFCFLNFRALSRVSTSKNGEDHDHGWLPQQPSLLLENPNRITIGYAVSITACNTTDTATFDGAAVLHHSIRLASLASSQYDYKMYAFLHSDGAECAPKLAKLGYDVQIKSNPVDGGRINNHQLRRLGAGGCCGFKEFIKLYAYMVEDAAIVVHLDLDTLVLKPMDHLFDLMLRRATISHEQVRPMWLQKNESFPSQIDFLFTRDYNMVAPYHRQPHQIGIQGGFLIIRPNQTAFHRMVEMIKGGGRYTTIDGWGGRKLKYGGYYGADTIQGFLAYFYGAFESHRALELNRCAYNNMADPPRHTGTKVCRTMEEDCESCPKTNLSDIYTVHFTVCDKPWSCQMFRKELCTKFHREWHRIRHDLQRGWSDKFHNYEPSHVKSDDEVAEVSYGHCKNKDIDGYIPILYP